MTLLSKNISKHFTIFLISTVFAAILFTIFLPPLPFSRQAKANSPISFSKKYNIITLDKKVQFKIKNMNKTNYAHFSVSNPSLASIGKKNGWLTPKKKGSLTVKAVIYNKKQKKIKTLTNHITIKEKKAILPNAVFKVKEHINPWDFTISLSCSRILLKNEINTDKLTITPKGKKNPKLTASFTNLSDDGKEVTYTLNTSSQEKLCPGDFSMDGTYMLESLHFSKKLSLTYKERLTKNTLSGFVLNTKGNSVKNALITLKKGTIPLKNCHTDSNGHYRLKNVSGADSLTVEKSGFQKSTLQNPKVSSKGTTCENIILRTKKETDAAIEFLITDKKNTPIPDTSIYILEEKNITSIKNPVSKNTEKISDANCMADSFSKDSILFSGKTNTNGKLLFANSSTIPNVPCSKLTLGEQNLLTYSYETSPHDIEKNIVPSSLFNCSKNYAIYIKNFSPDHSRTAYQTQKIVFSFSNLLSNYALLHIKLDICKQTYLKDLSITSDISPSFCRYLMFQFYYPNKKESFYQCTIEKNHFSISDNQIIISSAILPVSLPDGRYYLCIQALSEENKVLSKSDIILCQISNSEVILRELILQKAGYARILAYGNFDDNTLSKASFKLYQRFDDRYFFIEDCETEPFSMKRADGNEEFSTSNLYLNILPDSDYILVPISGDITAEKYLSFHTTKQNIFPTKENAVYSQTPLAHIDCLKKDLNHTTNSNNPQHDSNLPLLSTPDDFYKSPIHISYKNFYNMTQESIRSNQTYPNCIIAIYKKNGTLLTYTLTTPPANKTNTNSGDSYWFHYCQNIENSDDISLEDSIIDIYTNNRLLVTSQQHTFAS